MGVCRGILVKMALHISPNSQNDRALIQAIQRGDVEMVCAALSDPVSPASPNVHWHSHYIMALELAIRRGNPQVVEALLGAGADPLFVYFNGPHQKYTPIFNPQVRQDPVFGPRLVAQVQAQWTLAPPDPALARAALDAFQDDHPSDRALLKTLNQVAPALTAQDWWMAALNSREPHLVDYVAFAFPPISPTEVLKQLPEWGCLQDSRALIGWMRSLPARVRTDFLVGSSGDGNRGALFASLGMMSHVAGPLWAAALEEPLVIQSIKSRQLGGLYLTRAMRYHVDVAQAWLARASDLGVDDVAAVRYDPSQGDMTNSRNAPLVLTHLPQAGDTLLDTHLRLPEGNRVSVKLCRELVKKGVVPTSHTLRLLCAPMTYSTPERQLTPLFRQWVKAGAIARPPGEPPVWEAVRATDKTGIAARLRAWCDSHNLSHTLPTKETAPSRPRM